MSICLCNLSADAALELVAKNKQEVTPAAVDLASLTADPDVARECLGKLAEKLPKPIELLVGNARQRRTDEGIACHVWQGALPGDGVLVIQENVYVTGPDLTLLQQATQLHQVKLCQMLGRYLGTWTPSEDSSNGQEERAPLTTFDSLNGFLRQVKGAKGAQNLALAMAYTCDGAASAPETSLQLVLSLPPEFYGFGLSQPTMNYKVDLSAEAKKLCSKKSIRIDLCWRGSRFGLEYQGSDHGGKLGEDYARWFAAREEGYELWFVAKEQLESKAQMNYIGHEVAKRIGYEPGKMAWPTEDELQKLLDILAGQENPKPLSRAELRKRRKQLRARCRG